MNSEAADLSDNLTRAIRDRDWTAASAVRDRLDLVAGREPWKLTDEPRPPVDATDWAQTARDLLSDDPERVAAHLPDWTGRG